MTSTATPADNTLVAGGSAPATPNNDTALSYTAGTLDALAGNDTITVTSSSLQSTLAAGGLIKGGAGIDNLKLAAGTTLNLEMLTANQTVKPIEQVEMITMQGGTSSLTMSANDVLSLGGANASTMALYSFTDTTKTALNGVTPTGTSSTGKVQFVVNGQTGDTLNLDALANDGVTSVNGASTGLLGNTSLAGSWAYQGTFGVTAGQSPDGVAHTYKVYNHSTTQAQVLVDTTVVVNTLTPITIAAISADTGASATDFVTTDQTLSYTGQVPAASTSARVCAASRISTARRVGLGRVPLVPTRWWHSGHPAHPSRTSVLMPMPLPWSRWQNCGRQVQPHRMHRPSPRTAS